ncbi:FAD-dependent oxidoreductase [Kribbella turkmenica]|uniref:FAD-dependent oxidoreductase n=1 Tax=Kribbella turkmenica TaxID=2530375 RepID=A0A4R4XAU2_9ACTN|nr:FAD-dependent oxidoreductase [Kribbella turkmenica]TDD27728.1 FAD-dependent oxidoreductase [Kribbella turkmenica]
MTTQGSVWPATATLPEYDGIHADKHADVVVVGGGLIGLTTALYLQQEGADVVLLEAGRVGARTSGNTTGKVTSQHSAIYADLLDRHGASKAGRYATANQAAVDEVAALADRLGIDCELVRTPAFVYSTRADSPLRREADVAAALGLPARFVDPGELGLPVKAAEVVRFDDQVQLHPARYLAGLAAAFTQAGGRIFENSRVNELNTDHDIQAVTARGPLVRANHAVVATLLPIGLTGGYFARTRPSRSCGIAVRLPVEAPSGMAISVDSPVRSTRPWPGGGRTGLIVVGSDEEADAETTYQGLVDWVGSTWDFEVVPEYRWSAHDYSTPDLLPFVGKAPGTPLLVATGMDKWGLTNGTVAAGILRDLVLDRENPAAGVYDAGRIGDVQAVAKLVKDNLHVGKEFAAGHLGRLKGGADHLEVGQGGLLTRDDGSTVGAYRDHDGELHTVDPVCTHLGCPLRWNQADTTWDCNCHGSRFGYTGEVLDGPTTKPLTSPR